MTRSEKYVPKHRDLPGTGGARKSHRKQSSDSVSTRSGGARRAVRSAGLMSGVAVAVTGVVVTAGALSPPTDLGSGFSVADGLPALGAAAGGAQSAANLASRSDVVSRSDSRAATDPAKVAALSQPNGRAVSGTEDISDEDPRTIAKALLAEFGFPQSEFDCLDSLYQSESGWRWNADNPSSSAYGIPQALPGSKMASAGADWETNPVTQIRWGLGYIQDRYGTPCAAWSFKRGRGWY
ncbi:MAG: lytic transglycosylase domain-containing protein [Nocardioides sp.]